MRVTIARTILFAANLLTLTFCFFSGALAFCLDRDRSLTQMHSTFWSEKDGAPSQITALAQTADGFLWIGSHQGLFLFDGVKFAEFKPNAGVELPSHSIYSLMGTPDGGLWIVFEPTGLGYSKNGSLTVFTRPGELPDSPVHCLARDQEGRIWGGTENGLALREGNRWVPIGGEWNLPREMIRYLLVDRDDTVWVATVKVVAFLKHGSKRFEIGGAVASGVTKLAQAKDGRVWLAETSRHEARPVPVSGHGPNSESPVISADGLQEALFDSDGGLWITRLDSGIMRIRYPEKLKNRKYGVGDPEVESFGAKDGFLGGFASQLLEDREGNIWVGCSNGLIRMRHEDVVPVSLPQRYQTLTLLAGRNSDLWVGTTSIRPLLHIRGESVDSEKGGIRVCSVLRDANGDVWWGSRTGIWRQRGAKFNYFLLPTSAVPDWMWDLIPSRTDNGVWVKLGDVGFVYFNQGVWNLHQWPEGVPSAGPFRYGPSASYRDSTGRLWFGYTSGDLLVLDGDRVTRYSRTQGLDLGRIKVIRGRGGHVWMGGELGLTLSSDGHFRRLSVANGEPIGAVSGIIETLNSGLWLNTMRGIVQIPPEEIRRFIADPGHRVAYRMYDYLDGLPGSPQMSFANSTAIETTDGQLWFATDSGLAWIDPAHLIRNTVPPPVSILSIGDEKGRRPISSETRFPAGTHAVEIDYAALSLTMPERVYFRYKLEAVDKDWQSVGTRRQAFYSNLGPGSYRFRVIACNNDGVWNEAGASLAFSIAPAWFQTNWFLILCVGAFLTLMWGLYQLRLQQMRRQFNERLEVRVNERTRIARELHDTLLQGLHGLMFEFQAARNLFHKRPEEALQALDGAITGTEQAITESQDAIENLRGAATAEDDLPQLIKVTGANLAASHSGDQDSPAFGLTVEGQQRALTPVIRDEIYRIAREVLRNAFRHAQARRIEAEILYDDDQFRLRVRDDGKGMDPQVLEKGSRPGHWGLQGVRERAQQIGAKLDVWSEAGAGTEVQLAVPASVAYRKTSSRSRFGWFQRTGNHEHRP